MRKLAFLALLLVACGNAQPNVTIATPSSSSASQSHVARPAEADIVLDVLAWLPESTVSVIVARGPFDMPAPDHRIAETADLTKPLAPNVVAGMFQGLALGLFGLENGGVLKSLTGQKVLVAVNAVAKFTTPHGLGEGPYEGCSIAVFDRAPTATGGDFSKKYEADVWTTHVAFFDRVALVCTDTAYMHALVARMNAHEKKRAFAPGTSGWRHLDTRAPAWGLHTAAGSEVVSFVASADRVRIDTSGPQLEGVAHRLLGEAKDAATETRVDGALETSLSLHAPGEVVLTSAFYLETLLGHVIFL